MDTEHRHLKELSDSEIEDLMQDSTTGHLGCYHRGEIYIVPLLFVYEDGFIYSHSLDGKKLEMMRANPHVCFQVERVRSLFDWSSVISWGRFEELKGGVEAARGLRLLKMKIAEMAGDEKVTPLEVELDAILSQAKIFRINVERMEGRSEGPRKMESLDQRSKLSGDSVLGVTD